MQIDRMPQHILIRVHLLEDLHLAQMLLISEHTLELLRPLPVFDHLLMVLSEKGLHSHVLTMSEVVARLGNLLLM